MAETPDIAHAGDAGTHGFGRTGKRERSYLAFGKLCAERIQPQKPRTEIILDRIERTAKRRYFQMAVAVYKTRQNGGAAKIDNIVAVGFLENFGSRPDGFDHAVIYPNGAALDRLGGNRQDVVGRQDHNYFAPSVTTAFVSGSSR